MSEDKAIDWGAVQARDQTFIASIVALTAERDTWRQRAEEAEEVETERWHCTVEGRTTPCGTCDGCRWHISSLRAALAAAERTVREQREVIEAAREVDRMLYNPAHVRGALHDLRQALAALAPDNGRRERRER